jgi:hypothetical protein
LSSSLVALFSFSQSALSFLHSIMITISLSLAPFCAPRKLMRARERCALCLTSCPLESQNPTEWCCRGSPLGGSHHPPLPIGWELPRAGAVWRPFIYVSLLVSTATTPLPSYLPFSPPPPDLSPYLVYSLSLLYSPAVMPHFLYFFV